MSLVPEASSSSAPEEDLRMGSSTILGRRAFLDWPAGRLPGLPDRKSATALTTFPDPSMPMRSEEHTSELQSLSLPYTTLFRSQYWAGGPFWTGQQDGFLACRIGSRLRL